MNAMIASIVLGAIGFYGTVCVSLLDFDNWRVKPLLYGVCVLFTLPLLFRLWTEALLS